MAVFARSSPPEETSHLFREQPQPFVRFGKLIWVLLRHWSGTDFDNKRLCRGISLCHETCVPMSILAGRYALQARPSKVPEIAGQSWTSKLWQLVIGHVLLMQFKRCNHVRILVHECTLCVGKRTTSSIVPIPTCHRHLVHKRGLSDSRRSTGYRIRLCDWSLELFVVWLNGGFIGSFLWVWADLARIEAA